MKYILASSILLICFQFMRAEIMILDFDRNSYKDIYYDFTLDVLRNSLAKKFDVSSDSLTKRFILTEKRYKDFFVSARKFQDDSKFRGFAFKLVYKDLKGEAYKLSVRFYSSKEKKLLIKKDLIFKPENLLSKVKEILDDVSGITGVLLDVENSIGISDSRVLSSYLRLMTLKKEKKYDLYIDELEFLKNWFIKYPVLDKLYHEELSRREAISKGIKNPFNQNPFKIREENLSFLNDKIGDDPVENFVRELMVDGYLVKYIDEMIVAVDEDSVEYELKVAYEIKLTKLYQALLNKKLKENGVNNKFSAFGRYQFSNDQKMNEHFIGLLKRQALTLSLFDEKNNLIAEQEFYVSDSDFDSGRYRHAEDLPFPLTPQGAASLTYKIAKTSLIYFTFENISKEKLKRVKSASLRFKFM